MAEYAGESLNRLQESLNATNVLSEDYKRLIQSYALSSYSEGYRSGQVKALELLSDWAEDLEEAENDDFLKLRSEINRRLINAKKEADR
jgi:hypothetical protein